jgi:hypothetical protein
MPDRLLDIAELANRLKIPAKTIRNKLCEGTWPIPRCESDERLGGGSQMWTV